MKSYRYIARDSSGQRKEGVKEAASSNDVLSWLREQGSVPISINEITGRASQKTKRTTSRGKRIKSADSAALCWQLTTMAEGGIAITTALETISDEVENPQLKSVLQQILERMQKGETFSSSVAQFPKVFNQLFCSMILAGETGGNLPDVLRKLAIHFENRDKLAKKVKSAMVYPIFVVSFIVLIVIFIMTFIVPRFRTIFEQLGGDLPAFTRGFMAFYDILRYQIHWIIGCVLVLIFGPIFASRTEKGHIFLSKFVLRLPMFGNVITQSFIAIFCRTMSTLIVSGVSVLESFDILKGMTNNDIMKGAVIKARENLVGGTNISVSLASVGFFPKMVINMIRVGEESGSLSSVLERTSDHYERKVDAAITTMTSMLEPIMIVTIGGIVLVVILALYLPIFSMSDVAGAH